MKKSMLFLALTGLLFSVCLTSCEKKKEDTKTKKIATYSSESYGWTNTYTYTRNAEGKVTKVYRAETGEGNEYNTTYNFYYDGSTITVKRIEHPDTEEKDFYTITIGSNGYASSFGDEWDTWTYTYNNDNYIVDVDRNGDNRSEITVANGNVTAWTRYSDGVKQTKDQTFWGDKNVGGIYTMWSEGICPSRWLMETGLFGKPSSDLGKTSKWQHLDVQADYSYVKDADGYPTKETKLYGGEPDEEVSFTWVEVAK
ncbi:MAG: hypothetical protein LBQ31_00330 [Bacteroidales bacterium]|jgi:hypothetical protein|nr:hypothetical protein [Bacteroidales bacterium]